VDQLQGAGEGGRGLAALVAQQVRPGQDRQRPGLLALVGAAAGPLHRPLQVLEGGGVVAHVGGAHAPHPADGGQLLVGLGQRLGPGQPGVGGAAPARLHLDVPQLAVGGHRRGPVASLGGQPDGLVEGDRPLLVAAADGMDQRAPEGAQGTAMQRRVAAAGGIGDRPAQAVQAGLDGSGGDRRPAGVELADHRRPPADRRPGGRPGRRGRRVPQRRRRLDPELPPQGVLTHRHLPQRRVLVPGGGQAADQQLVVPLVERVPGHRPRGVRHRLLGPPGRQQAHRRLPQPSLDHPRDPVPLHHQPRLEGGTGRDAEALQQLTAQVQQHRQLVQRIRFPGQRPDVDLQPGAQLGGDRITPEQHRRPQRPPQLGQRPPQRAQRVVRVPEQQLRQLPATGRPLGQQQVGQQRPRLAPARGGDRPPVALQRRRPQQADAQRHEPSPAPSSPSRPRPTSGPSIRADRVRDRVREPSGRAARKRRGSAGQLRRDVAPSGG